MRELSSTNLELEHTQRLLACIIYEIKSHMLEGDPPTEILDNLANLIEHAPPSVIALVEYLESNSPKILKEGTYGYALPCFQWKFP